MLAGRHDGAPPGESALAARRRAESLDPHRWGNSPRDTYRWHEHHDEKAQYYVDGHLVCHTASADIELGPGDRLVLPPHTPHAATAGADGARSSKRPTTVTSAEPRAHPAPSRPRTLTVRQAWGARIPGLSRCCMARSSPGCAHSTC